MAKSNSKRILIFAGLGLLSALLTGFSGYSASAIGGFFKQAWPLFLGTIFGIVFAVYAWATGVCRSIWRLASFAVASSVAYALAVLGSMPLTFVTDFLGNILGQQVAAELGVVFTGGVIGAAIVFGSFVALIAPPSSWKKSAIKLVAFSLGSGFLGMFAWGMAALLEKTGPTGNVAASYCLFVIWQTGAGIMLAYLLPSPGASNGIADSSVIAERKLVTRIARQALAVLVTLSTLVALVFLIRRETKGYQSGVRYRARQEEAQKRAIAERPFSENLPEITAQKLEQLLVLKSIHGIEMDPSSASQTGLRNPIASATPPFVNYLATYGTLDRDGRLRPGHMPLVTASVTVYPNAEWARYELRNIPTYSMIEDPEHNLLVNKFGNKVYMYTAMRYPDGGGSLSFFWPSGQRTVVIKFEGEEDDEFIKEYLVLHPSSL